MSEDTQNMQSPISLTADPKKRRGRPAKVPKVAAPVDESDPRVRAAKRASELLDQGVHEVCDDEFFIDRRIIPDGWDYEWKRRTVLNQPDPSYQTSVAQRGWEPVPLSRHPTMMPEGWVGATIEKRGMILMERPMEITEEAKRRERMTARDQVRAKEEQLNGSAPGTFERVDGRGQPTARVKKSFEPGTPIPEK